MFKKFKKKWIIALLVTLSIGIAGTAFMEYRLMKGKTMMPGVYIGQVDVGRMGEEQVREKIIPLYQKAMEREISIKGGGKVWSFSPEQLGVKEDVEKTLQQAWSIGRQGPFWQRWYARWEARKHSCFLPLAFHVDEHRLAQNVVEMAQMINKEAQNAGVFVKNDHQVEIVTGVDGLTVKTEDSVQALKEVLQSGDKNECTLITQVTPPLITEEVVESWQINGIVAQYETSFDPAKEDRSANIKMAAMALDHILVMPQEIFSFNEIVGPRTTEAGYKEALVIENNEFTPGIGGGVCQVSTTLYNALLKSNLPILERHPHSLPISYVPHGMDATVAYNLVDLKFTNDREKPILLHTEYQKGKIKVMIFATVGEFPEVRLSSKIVEYIQAEQEIIKDPSLPPGRSIVEAKGQRGMIVEVYREIIMEGNVLSRERISRDKYKPVKSVVRISVDPE